MYMCRRTFEKEWWANPIESIKAWTNTLALTFAYVYTLCKETFQVNVNAKSKDAFILWVCDRAAKNAKYSKVKMLAIENEEYARWYSLLCCLCVMCINCSGAIQNKVYSVYIFLFTFFLIYKENKKSEYPCIVITINVCGYKIKWQLSRFRVTERDIKLNLMKLSKNWHSLTFLKWYSLVRWLNWGSKRSIVTIIIFIHSFVAFIHREIQLHQPQPTEFSFQQTGFYFIVNNFS